MGTPKSRSSRFDVGTLQIESSSDEHTGLTLLVATASGLLSREIPVSGALVLGRDEECDIPLVDSSVSRRHAVIHAGTPPSVEDLGSTNGTRVSGRKLGRGERVVLGPNAVVELGSTVAVVRAAASDHSGEDGPRDDERGDATAPTIVGDGVIIRDSVMKQNYQLLESIAPTALSVLILGETGVGKEVFASAVHKKSKRSQGPLIQFNCAAVAESVLESELFGYEKGAFTGALARKVGLLEAAHGGTVFLDEVGELPLTTQAKLLRFLESGEVLRVGAVKPTQVDVRIVSATNRELQTLVADGRFRADLFFRLNGICVTLPPLRLRRDDIAPLAELFLTRACEQLGRPKLVMTADFRSLLESYPWPGNVRELRHAIQRAAVLCIGSALDVRDLQLSPALGAALPSLGAPTGQYAVPFVPYGASPASSGSMPAFAVSPATHPASGSAVTVAPPAVGSASFPVSAGSLAVEGSGGLHQVVEKLERDLIVDALERCAGNQSRAAKLLGITRHALLTRLDAYGISRPRKKPPVAD